MSDLDTVRRELMHSLERLKIEAHLPNWPTKDAEKWEELHDLVEAQIIHALDLAKQSRAVLLDRVWSLIKEYDHSGKLNPEVALRRIREALEGFSESKQADKKAGGIHIIFVCQVDGCQTIQKASFDSPSETYGDLVRVFEGGGWEVLSPHTPSVDVKVRCPSHNSRKKS